MRRPLKGMSTLVPAPMKARVEAVAAKRGLSQSDIVRMCITLALDSVAHEGGVNHG